MVLGKWKRLKVSQNNDNDNNMEIAGEDKISELSDPLLLHILSFIPIKCAVSTSILSQRWRYVWTSIPILDFRKWRSHKSQTRLFTKFMDRLMVPHDGMPNIQEFYLDYDKNLSISRVNEWISTLVQRKVEKLHLFIEYRPRSVLLAPCLFTCESLTMLELESNNILKLPGSISFPRLKILRLTDIAFVDWKLTNPFFSNFPLLEELIMTNCSWDMKYVIILAPALKYLSFNFSDRNDQGYLANCVVKIKAPNLLSFGYTERVAMDYLHCNFPSLVDANIDLRPDDNDEYWVSEEDEQDMGYAANKLVQNLSNVKVLKMSCDTFQHLSFADDLVTNLPTFHNLIHLEVTSSPLRSIIGVFFDFLQVTPNLESLIFAEDPCKSHNDDGWTLNLVPECLLLHLKTVKFRSYHGFTRSNELTWVKLFLKNAAVLQKMTITASSRSSENYKIEAEIMEEILMFPRASTNCVVQF